MPKLKGNWGLGQVSRVGREAIVFKGSREGISILIDEAAQITEVINELRKKLQPAPGFFAGAAVRVDTGERTLEPQERQLLAETVEEFGLILSEEADGLVQSGSQPTRTGDQAPTAGEGGPRAATEETAPGTGPDAESTEGADASSAGSGMLREFPADDRARIVRRTLRSGQRVDHDGHVIILGDVNPGAVVTCTGDILVLGSLRGVAHAGAGGNAGAMVMAFRLEPTQLRIAHFISRAPDEAMPHPAGPEVAVVKEDIIQIEAYVP